MKVPFQVTYCPGHRGDLLGQCPVRDLGVEASGYLSKLDSEAREGSGGWLVGTVLCISVSCLQHVFCLSHVPPITSGNVSFSKEP